MIREEIKSAVETCARPAIEKLLGSFPSKEVLESTISELKDGLIKEMMELVHALNHPSHRQARRLEAVRP